MSNGVVLHARPKRFRRLLGPVLLLCLGACAGKHPAADNAQRAQPVRMAWMPVDPLDLPDVAEALNDHLARVKVAGATAGFRAAVSMEVAQLAIECIEPTPACYAAVGRSLGADRVLWAEMDTAPSPEEKVRVALVLFDVRAGAAPTRVERTFDGVQAARAGVADLVDHAFDPGRRAP